MMNDLKSLTLLDELQRFTSMWQRHFGEIPSLHMQVDARTFAILMGEVLFEYDAELPLDKIPCKFAIKNVTIETLDAEEDIQTYLNMKPAPTARCTAAPGEEAQAVWKRLMEGRS